MESVLGSEVLWAKVWVWVWELEWGEQTALVWAMGSRECKCGQREVRNTQHCTSASVHSHMSSHCCRRSPCSKYHHCFGRTHASRRRKGAASVMESARAWEVVWAKVWVWVWELDLVQV
jgi:hypothetical protein